MTIQQWLQQAESALKKAGVSSSHLDAQLLLALASAKDRTWLIAHNNEFITPEVLKLANSLLKRRENREPMAYIRGSQEFYGRDFVVTPNTLIPRPESEQLIERLHQLKPTGSLIDIGTGPGALAVTCALEFPALKVSASDVSPKALTIAKQNAQNLGAHVSFFSQNLLAHDKNTYNFIVANLPYVDPDWIRSTETNFEPSMALFADDKGLALIKTLIAQASPVQHSGSHVLLEADPRQHTAIATFAAKHGYTTVFAKDFCVDLLKI